MTQLNRKNCVADPRDYPPVAPKGYYALAFRKTQIERSELKEIQLEHKQRIADEYKEYSAHLRRRIMNPTKQTWTS